MVIIFNFYLFEMYSICDGTNDVESNFACMCEMDWVPVQYLSPNPPLNHWEGPALIN